MVGLVFVVQVSGFLGFGVSLRPGLPRFIYVFLGFRVFQCLEVFLIKGVS